MLQTAPATSNWFLKQVTKGNHHPGMYVHAPVPPDTRRPCVLGWQLWLPAQHLLLLQCDVGLLRHMLEMLLKSGLEAASSIITPQPDSHLPYFTGTTGVIYCNICQVPLHSHKATSMMLTINTKTSKNVHHNIPKVVTKQLFPPLGKLLKDSWPLSLFQLILSKILHI